MDQLKKYKKLVKETLEEHVHPSSRDFPNLQDFLIIDANEQHFIVFTIGWDRGRYHHLTVYHLEVKDNGKIWIHQLNSDVEIDVELIEKGVDKADIIGGMMEPYTLAEAEEGIDEPSKVGIAEGRA